MCHNMQQQENNQNSTQNWKGLVKHNKDHGIIAMNDHVSSKHCAIMPLSQAQWQFVITMALINHQIIKKRKNGLIPSTTMIYYYHGIF
jgi:hypothetical protein